MPTLTPDQWKSLSPRLDVALEMSETERVAWLTSLRRENPTLVAELEILLEERRSIVEEGFLEKGAVRLPEEQGLAGQTLGPYTLISQIGQGGMGSVWLAERSDGRFERQVAIKFLNVALMGKSGIERFRREGSILGRLTHPNIGGLLDAGVASTGLPYLVLERVEGDHIDRYCDDRNLSIEARIRLFLDVLAAIAHSHTNLIVHRDIKPANVLVRKDGQVKLLDFGIAKLLEGQDVEATVTGEAGRALTPEYASPEQLRGEGVTTATDLYALGVLLYVLLTGQHPVGSGPHTLADLVSAIIAREPMRPSEAVTHIRTNPCTANTNAALRASTPLKLSRTLRGDLDTIVIKALKKEPCERYASVTALADDLRHYLKNEPIGARPDSIAYRIAKFVRRNRLAVALTTMASLAVLGGAAGTLSLARSARQQRDFAVRQLARAEQVNGLNELLLSDIAPLGKPVTPNQLLEHEESIIQRQHYDNAADHVELLISIGAQYSGEEENQRAMRVLSQAYSLSRGVQDHSTRAKASCELAWAMVPSGNMERAESLLQEGLRELPDDPQLGSAHVLCLLHGAEIAYRQGQAEEVLLRAKAAERVFKASAVQSPLLELNLLTSLAGAYQAVGKSREAVAAFERASTRMTEMGYDRTQKAVRLYNDWGLTLADAGQPLDAERAYRHAIEISEGNDRQDDVLATLLHNYSAVLRDLGRLREADDYSRRAEAKAQQNGDNILATQAQLQQARILRDQHEFARASISLSAVELRMRQQLPPGHYGFAALSSDKSLLAQAEGDSASALRFANQAIAIDEASMKAGGQGSVQLPMLLVRRSAVELALRNPKQAEMDASKAVSLLQSRLQPGSVSNNLGRAYLALARTQQSQRKTREAVVAFRLAAEHLQKTLGPDHPDTRSAMDSE